MTFVSAIVRRLRGDRETLRFVSGPTRVSLAGRVASSNAAVSPLTDMRAALLRIGAGVRRVEKRMVSEHDGHRYEEVEVFDEIDSMLVAEGASVLVETADGAVEVPLAGLEVVFPTDALGVVSLDRPLPPPLAQVVAEADDRDGVAAYREQTLSHGDAVRLDGWVGPTSGGRAPWVLLTDRGGAVLYDRSLDDVDLEAMKGRSRWLGYAVFAAVAALVLGIAVQQPRDEEAAAPSPPPEARFTDSEGRSFRALREGEARGELLRVSGPDIAAELPGEWFHIYAKWGRVIGVCDIEWRKLEAGTRVGTPDPELCRAFVCSTDADCPPLEGASCSGRHCLRTHEPLDWDDYSMLCRAGTGLGATEPLVGKEAFEASCAASECRIPAGCPQP